MASPCRQDVFILLMIQLTQIVKIRWGGIEKGEADPRPAGEAPWKPCGRLLFDTTGEVEYNSQR